MVKPGVSQELAAGMLIGARPPRVSGFSLGVCILKSWGWPCVGGNSWPVCAVLILRHLFQGRDGLSDDAAPSPPRIGSRRFQHLFGDLLLLLLPALPGLLIHKHAAQGTVRVSGRPSVYDVVKARLVHGSRLGWLPRDD